MRESRKKGPFHIQNRRTNRSVLAECKRPLTAIHTIYFTCEGTDEVTFADESRIFLYEKMSQNLSIFSSKIVGSSLTSFGNLPKYSCDLKIFGNLSNTVRIIKKNIIKNNAIS